MWTRSGGDGPDEERYRRMSAPDNELPVALPLNTVLARTGDVAVALLGLQVHTTGLAFDLAVRVRPAAASRMRLDGLFWGASGQPQPVPPRRRAGRRAAGQQRRRGMASPARR
jgi:hypothetical protein